VVFREGGGERLAAVTITVYGIPNCDTVKKARAWLTANGVEHAFHDFKKAGVSAAMLDRWAGDGGWERLLNRAGTTFRKLPDADKLGVDRDKASALMLAHPSLIKRPVVEGAGALLIGFAPDMWAQRFG
jgi:arsenate reductase (glutaredoxin)